MRPAPSARLAVCAALNERGLPCGVLMGPIVPFLSDSPAQLEPTVRQIAAAGATHVSPIVLHLRTGAREWFFRWLRERHPSWWRRTRSSTARGLRARRYQRQIGDRVSELARKYGVGRAGPGQARAAGRVREPGPVAAGDPDPAVAAAAAPSARRDRGRRPVSLLSRQLSGELPARGGSPAGRPPARP